MPTRAEPLRIGPFTGGLNLATDASSIADSELSVCDNFEVDLDGTLVTRPAIEETVTTNTIGMTIIGRGNFPGGQNFLIASKSDTQSDDNGIYVYNGKIWINIEPDLVSSVAVQHGGFVWIVPKPGSKATQAGGRWDPVNGFVVDNNMPEGEGALFYKARMFITPGPTATTNGSRLQFTDVITSSTLSWPAANIIDVSPGDGQNLMDLIVLNDSILLFKSDSTYILAYDINPSEAIIRMVNSSIGVSAQQCLQVYENSIFTLHQGKVYEIINYDFAPINIKVPFEVDQSFSSDFVSVGGSLRMNPVFMSRLGDRLVVGYFNRIYAYSLITKTWSTWSSTTYRLQNLGPIWEMPTDDPAEDNPIHYSLSNMFNEARTLTLRPRPSISKDRYVTGTTETEVPIISTFKTKVFDFATSHQFKKLMWWGVDMIGFNVTGNVIPFSANTFSTWASHVTDTYGSVDENPWMQLDNVPGVTETSVADLQIPGIRTFQKFAKTLRFRMLQFEVSITHNGSTLDGPVRVFSLTAILNTKQTVGKQVN